MKSYYLTIILAMGIFLSGQEPPFRNPKLPVERRVADLVSRLTLAEKVGLMQHAAPGIERLGIPAYNWWSEALHGVARAGRATVFPQVIGLAATFDEALIRRLASAIGDEARAKHHAAQRLGSHPRYGGLTFWAPNINIFRDPRWGRGQETYGEDPLLTSRLGVAFVRGLQGDDPRYLKAAAGAKHFAVHSGPEPIRHQFNAVVSERDLRETYLPAFKALVEADVEAVMCAYNRTNGEPCCSSQALLVKILRGEWGFSGHVVSDCWALNDIWEKHKVVETPAQAAAMALKAGVDLECGQDGYRRLPEALQKGLVTVGEIDAALKTLLRTQFKLGLYDPPESVPYSRIPESVVNCQAHRDLAYEAAVRSLVLLKNRNSVLPLKKDLKHIFLTGPNAASLDVLLGNYNGYSGGMVTMLEGVMDKVGAGTMVEYRQGCPLRGGLKEYDVGLARQADATIAVIGLSPQLEGEEGDAMLSDHGGDRGGIGLPAGQADFIRALRENNPKPLILVVTGGSAVSLAEVEHLADAILFAWYPGEEGGRAVADALFGDAAPAGRLPVTFYRSLSDLPAFEDYRMQNRTYRYFAGEPEFPFGFGLSYTTFEYGGVTLDSNKLKANETLGIAFLLTNSGGRDGEEVVQVYVRPRDRRPDDPLLQLKDFRRIALPAGASRLVQFRLRAADWSFWDEKSHSWKLAPGEYEILLGASSKDIRQKAIVRVN